jgi:AraC-like DNA-binding protein
VVPVEDSYVVNISLNDLDARFWLDGKQVDHNGAGGGLYLLDLQSDPIADFASAFDIVRFYAPRATLDALTRESGLGKPGGLSPPPLGTHDRVLVELARAMLPALQAPEQTSQLYVDYMALAFHSHLVTTYGGHGKAFKRSRQGLSSIQARTASELIDARLDGKLSVTDLVAACNLSLSHFSRAFVQTYGMPPHRWLLERRVDRAKSLMEESAMPLVEIAVLCGFASQSHFARVFATVVGIAPSRWRRRATRMKPAGFRSAG